MSSDWGIDESCRQFVEHAQEFILRLNNEGTVLFVNNHVVEQSGIPSDQWIGKQFTPVVYPDDLSLVQKHWKTLISGHPASFTFRIWGKDDEIIWLQAEAIPIIQDNNTIAVLFFGKNISDLKQIEMELRDSQNRYRSLSSLLEGTFNGIQDVIAIQDPTHRIIRYNKAGYEFLGMKPEDVDGKRCFELLGNTLPCFPCSTSKCIQTKQAEHLEKYIPDLDLWLDCRAYPILDFDGNLELVIEHLRDITEQKLMQKKLSLFKHAVDSSTEAISMATFEGKQWYRNSAFNALFGNKSKQPIEALYVDKKQAQIVLQRLRTGDNFSGEVMMINAQGKHIIVLLRAYPIVDSQSKIIGQMGIYIDISAQKEAEQKLRDSEFHYRNLYETSLAGLWRTRKSDGKFLKANLTTARFLGLKSVEELIEKYSASDFYQNPDDRQKLLALLSENNGIVTEFVINFRLPNGELRNYMISCRDFPRGGYLEGVVTDITKQKRAELAAQKLKEDLQTTLNSIGDAVIATDIHGIINRMNPTAETLTGWQVKDAIGRHLSEVFVIVDSQTRIPLPDPVSQILTEGRIVNLPSGALLLAKTGDFRLVSDSGAPIKDSEGRTIGVVLVFRDVTREFEMEETLRSSENRFRSMAELLPVGIFETDENVILTFVNSQGLTMFGYTNEDVQKGIHGFSIFDDESKNRAQQNLKLRLAGSSIRVVEYTGMRKDGTLFPVLFYITPVFDGSGKFIGLRGAMIDITDQKKTEEELRESEEFSSSLLQNSPQAIVVMNDDSSIKFVNPAFERITGFSSQNVIGISPPYPWWPPNRHDEAWDSLTQLMNDRLEMTEQLFEAKCGRHFWIQMSAARILREDGSIKNYICSWVEITKRKQMEEKLTQLSFHDSLTGLYNRAFFEEEIRRHKKSRMHPISVVICDIDGLKLINETMGHQAGDELLQKAAEILRLSFRKSDIIARIGGDEFAIILPHTSALVTRTCCSRIKTHLNSHNQTSDSFYLSISVGYAVGEEIQTDLEELYRIADHNMYREKLQQSHSTRSDIVKSLIRTMEDRDYINHGHADRLKNVVTEMCTQLKFNEQKLNEMHLLCRFHDLGIVSIPEHILFKKSKLTPDEMKEVQGHCEIGYRIALSVSDLAPIADFILKHHEYWNGEGYPLGLKGEEIPVESRILAIADAFDAMTSKRPYKNELTMEEARKELLKCAGEQFDPNLVSLLVKILDESK